MFYVYDYYGEWATAVGKPVTTTCMTSQSCIPESFGKLSGLFSFNAQGTVIDDGDHFHFEKNPVLTALAFSGFAVSGKPFGLAINGMGTLGGAPLYLFSSTGFIGVVAKSANSFKPGNIIAAPKCGDIVMQMHFAA
jgi:hypothetical protein